MRLRCCHPVSLILTMPAPCPSRFMRPALQQLRAVVMAQRKKPGPPHRARNALLYLQLRQADVDVAEVRDLLATAGLDSMP